MLLPFPTAAALAFAALVAFAAPATSSRAQTAPAAATSGTALRTPLPGTENGWIDVVQLLPYTVSASRTAQDSRRIPSSVTLLEPDALAFAQTRDLRAALTQVPGLTVVNAGGAAGGMSSVFIRGAGASHTLFMVDGIRMNSEDWTSGYNNFLGAAGLGGLGHIEVLRGPQSTLYGSSAMGGVVSLTTRHESFLRRGNVITLDGGSFNTIGAALNLAGSAPVTTEFTSRPQTLSYGASLSASYTENDRDFNTFRQISGSTRLEYRLADTITAGLTYRGLKARYEEPGPTYSPFDAGVHHTTNNLVTTYVAWRPASPDAPFASRLTYGWVQNIYDWRSAWSSYAHSTRNVLDWQNNWKPLPDMLELVAGLNTEWSLYNSGDAALRDRLASLCLNAVCTPIKNLNLTAGVRGDNYNTLDTTRATWRAGAAYRIQKTKTTLRATIGTGFNAPAPQYVLGGGWYSPSPDLNPETSTGWDIGFEQQIPNNNMTLGAVFFRNDFSNKFSAAPDTLTPWLYKYGNIPGATTKGVEAYIYGRPLSNTRDPLHIQLAYTYLDARNSTGARLIQMPRHTLTVDVNCRVTQQFDHELRIGAGVSCIVGRPEETYWDMSYTPHTQKMGGYTLVRAYASYTVRNDIKLKLRVENLLNKKYDTIAGYPALPLGVFGGVEWRF